MTTTTTFLLTTALAASVACGQRAISFNGRPLDTNQMKTLEALERYYSARLPEGSYWYDDRTGAMGQWGGPAFAIVRAGLKLGGPMPQNCSGGATGVFINGRELHVLDVIALSQIGQVYPGRYWVNSLGDFGYERGPKLGNLVELANQRQGGGGGQHRVYSAGELGGVIVNPAGACTSSGCFYPR